MPATATDNWQLVQDTAVSIGSISEAARRCGVNIAAACQRAKREGWMVGQRPAKALAAAKAVHAEAVAKANPAAVIAVTTVSEHVINTVEEYGNRSKIAHAEAGARAAEAFQTLPATEIIDKALARKALIDGDAKLHGWEKPASAAGLVNISFIRLDLPSTGTVQGRVVDEATE